MCQQLGSVLAERLPVLAVLRLGLRGAWRGFERLVLRLELPRPSLEPFVVVSWIVSLGHVGAFNESASPDGPR